MIRRGPTTPESAAVPTRDRRRAFTLIEVLVVVVILSILTAAIAPQFSGTLDDARLRAASRSIASSLHLAHSQAVSTGKPCQLRLDLAERRYWLETWEAAGELGTVSAAGDVTMVFDGSASDDAFESGSRWRPFDKLPSARGTLPDGVEVSVEIAAGGAAVGEDEAFFDTFGDDSALGGFAYASGGFDAGEPDLSSLRFEPDGSAEGKRIVLRSAGGFALAVQVHPMTARVRVRQVDRLGGQRGRMR